jgi:oligo-1,6-glucosidase
MVFHFEVYSFSLLPPHPLTPRQLNWIDQSGPSRYVPRAWTLPEMKTIINRWQTLKRADGFWNALYVQNHDNAWAVSRFGNASSQWRAVSAKLLCMLQICQAGTLFVYQGEELGMVNSPREWGIEEYKDKATLNYYDKFVCSACVERPSVDE